jgi:L-ascorbate metabolism protein UlaG (beta-lactamase superfamily)
MMNRRRFLKFLAAPALILSGGTAFAAWRQGNNPYYSGPVSDHFDGIRFFNPQGRPNTGFTQFLRWQLGGGREAWPETYPSPHRDRPPERVDGSRLRVSFVGHASVLIQTQGLNILHDPVLSERASPFGFVGPKRLQDPGIAFADLPPLDLILVSHNHYDHLDLGSLSRLRASHPQARIITPLGNDTIMHAHDPALQASAHDWGDRIALSSDVVLHVEPMHHWSARGLLDRRMALWAAFVIETPGGKLYLVGDSGYNEGRYFTKAREKHGGFRFAFLPIGAYEPRWFMSAQHMNPDDAVRAFRDCGARHALAHHWGTFRLTNEGIERPLADFKTALATHGVSPEVFRAMQPGGVWDVPGL